MVNKKKLDKLVNLICDCIIKDIKRDKAIKESVIEYLSKPKKNAD